MSRTEDLIKLSGVSRSTIFRYLRGENVRPEAKTSIIAAMNQLSLAYPGQDNSHEKILQISVRKDFRSFKGYNQAIAGFMGKAELHGFQVNLRAGSLREQEPASLADSRKPSGALIIGLTIEEEEFELEWFRKSGIPCVFVNRVFEDPAVSWVSCDLRLAAEEAVTHLLDLGHTNIGTWGLTKTSRIDRAKREGFLEAFKKRGILQGPCCLDYHTHGDLEQAVQKLVDTGKLPDAWFSASDEHAMRFIKIAKTNGIRIPDDIALISMDDADSSEYLTPALTTIRMPFQAEGAIAFDVLKKLTETPNMLAQHVLMKHSLIVRESCGFQNRAGSREKKAVEM
jgi:DNA-binding LacI/PurR family transcriptional regulator